MTRPTSSTTVYLLFDERMVLHQPPPPSSESEKRINAVEDEDDASVVGPFENSSRITSLYHRMLKLEQRLLRHQGGATSNYSPMTTPQARFIPLQPTPCPRATIELAHSRQHYNTMRQTRKLSDEELRGCAVEDDLYFGRNTFMAASLACGGVVNCVDAVLDSWETGVGPTRAIALVRPPGHHATRDQAMGFCYFNNIAVAAKHAIHSGKAERVFILDWDIHHGNGIQDITYDDPNIFYLSIHRAKFGTNRSNDWFYPGTGRPGEVGTGPGAGTNLNIVWSKGGMGNVEYAAAFVELVLPVLASFNPDLIVVACGLDAAQGDLLGDCGLSPDMYYIMTQSLLETAGIDTPLVVALEGGYDLETISNCMDAIALALFDEPYLLEETLTEESRSGADERNGSCRELRSLPSADSFNLSRYWRHEDLLLTKDMPKRTRIAIASIKRSARALASKGRCFGSMRFLAKAGGGGRGASPMKEIVPLYNRPFQNEYRPMPKKKRKLLDGEASPSAGGSALGVTPQAVSSVDIHLRTWPVSASIKHRGSLLIISKIDCICCTTATK